MTEKIRVLIKKLPAKDRTIAEQYLKKCDYDSLSELVDSAIDYAENKKGGYKDADVSTLYKLQAELVNKLNEIGSDEE